MAFKEVLWNLRRLDNHPEHSFEFRLENDKKCHFGINGNMPGSKYYIPVDSKIGGL